MDREVSDKAACATLVVCYCAFSIGKLAAVIYFIPRNLSIFELGFLFGPYIRTLAEHGRFAVCMGPRCDTASRMPLLPLLFYGIGFISRDQRTVGLIKAVLLSVIFLPSFLYLLRLHRALSRHAMQCWSAIGVLVFLSPPVVKHAAALTYEEGILVEVLLLWAYSYLLLILSYAKEGWEKHGRMLAIMTIALAVVAYLTKSSMVLVLLLSELTTFYVAIRHRDMWVVLALGVCFSVMAGWGFRNEFASNHFSTMSSWDGEHLFRGWNGESAKLYPDVVLDRLFDSRIGYLANGTMVTIQLNLPRESSRNEWEWDAYFRHRTTQWAKAHPWEALKFSVRKLYFFLIAIRKTPYTYTNDARGSRRPSVELYSTEAWLLAGRCLEGSLLVLLWMLWRTRDRTSRFLAGSAIAICLAYAAPYLIGFGYERHVTVLLVLVGVCCAVLSAEVWEIIDRKNARP